MRPPTTMGPPSNDDSVWVAVATSAWFLSALVAGAAGALLVLPPPFPQVVLLALVVALLAAFRLSGTLRRWAMAVDLRILVLVHLSRLVGLYFLVLHSRGDLPFAFAVPGGIGDIVVALLALVLVLAVPLETPGGRGLLLAWNTLGLADILYVVVTATRLGLADPYAMRALFWLPLSLLPTFLVPLIIVTHLLIFARVLAEPRR